MNSVLGQYGPAVAAITSLGVVAVYVLAVFAQSFFNIPDSSLTQLQQFAFLAGGVIFGSTVATNGWKQPVTELVAKAESATELAASAKTAALAANARLDTLGAGPAKDGL